MPYLINAAWYVPVLVSLVVLLAVEWIYGRQGAGQTHVPMPANRMLRWGMYLALIAFIYYFGNFSYRQFIYFQF